MAIKWHKHPDLECDGEKLVWHSLTVGVFELNVYRYESSEVTWAINSNEGIHEFGGGSARSVKIGKRKALKALKKPLRETLLDLARLIR